jgi:hypothetical protein
VNKWNDYVLGEEYKKGAAKLHPVSKEYVPTNHAVHNFAADKSAERKRSSRTHSTLSRKFTGVTTKMSSDHPNRHIGLR